MKFNFRFDNFDNILLKFYNFEIEFQFIHDSFFVAFSELQWQYFENGAIRDNTIGCLF